MRFLPDKPSLHFLRKEAKDLLAVLRESSAEASLADAQQALATQYGLRSWTELKAEAERRMADPPAAPDGLAGALAIAFGLGRVTSAASPVSFTPMGRSWSITTDRGRWLAVTVHPWIDEAQAEVGARLRDAAVAAGIAAPTPVRSPSGCLIETVRGETWRIHEWIEVGPSPVTPTPTAVARRVGGSKLVETLPVLADLRTIGPDTNGLETILCNCNLIPQHVRAGHDEELVVTEWDFAGSLTPELELGSALSHWAPGPPVDTRTIAAFRDGYIDAAGRWPELAPASFAVAVTGYLNWTYDTICEAIGPDGKDIADSDRAAFADREVSDPLDRPMTRATLEQLLAAL